MGRVPALVVMAGGFALLGVLTVRAWPTLVGLRAVAAGCGCGRRRDTHRIPPLSGARVAIPSRARGLPVRP
eukprot:COSAG01_NODE_7131_length_3336_cov_957.309546_6_plen_71_part_00